MDNEEVIERLVRIEEGLKSLQKGFDDTTVQLVAFEAWKNRVAGAQQVVTVVSSAAVALFVSWASHWFIGSGGKSPQ